MTDNNVRMTWPKAASWVAEALKKGVTFDAVVEVVGGRTVAIELLEMQHKREPIVSQGLCQPYERGLTLAKSVIGQTGWEPGIGLGS